MLPNFVIWGPKIQIFDLAVFESNPNYNIYKKRQHVNRGRPGTIRG
jgi:hypothetical protein